jgi:elongation factor P
MLVVSELRSGMFYEEAGTLWQVLSYEHIKLGRGSATIKVKVKNVRSGSTTEKGFINGAKVNDVQVIKKELQYLYRDDDTLYFMDPVSFEQVGVGVHLVTEPLFLKEGVVYMIAFFGEEALEVILPPKVELKVADTAPGVKGNSAGGNVTKEAVMENGFKTKVPLFITVGDMVRVDTRTGAYTERAS